MLAESNAILRYLAEREGRDDLLPADTPERAAVDWLLDAVATTLRPACREIDAPAYGFRPQRGIGAEPPQPEDVPRRDRGASRRGWPRSRACSATAAMPVSAASRVADCAAMPSLWRLLHAGALQAHPRCGAGPRPSAHTPRGRPVAAESGVPA